MSDLTITVTPEELVTLRAWHTGGEITLGALRPLLNRLAEQASLGERVPMRTESEIRERIASYEERLTSPKLKKSAIPVVVNAKRELEWVLGITDPWEDES
jgi:hypothetical protein